MLDMNAYSVLAKESSSNQSGCLAFREQLATVLPPSDEGIGFAVRDQSHALQLTALLESYPGIPSANRKRAALFSQARDYNLP